MLQSLLTVLLLFSSFGYAHDTDEDTDQETSNSTTQNSIEGENNVHIINVASDTFAPISIIANPDDVIRFTFRDGNHSVIQSLYGWPCIPRAAVDGAEGFHSGFFPILDSDADSPTWDLVIQNTDPIYFYCGAPGSCVNKGMLGAINPGDTNVTKQIELARQSRYMLEYDETMTPAESASVVALASNVLAEPDEDDEGLSTGVVAGIAVGGAALVALIGALLFFLRRNRKLKKQLVVNKEQSMQTSLPRMRGEHETFFPTDEARAMASANTTPLPPYYAHFTPMDSVKSPEPQPSVRSMGVEATNAPYIPYRTIYNEQSTRFSETSELGGDLPTSRYELNADPVTTWSSGLEFAQAR